MAYLAPLHLPVTPCVPPPRQALTWLLLVITLLSLTACGRDPTVDAIDDEPYYQDPALLEQAWSLPVADTYWPGFEYQDNAAFCGPATAVNVLRSLGLASVGQWEVFEGSDVWAWKARFLGLTLDQMAQVIAAQEGVEVTLLRDLSLAEFKGHLRQSNDPRQRYIINFGRHPLFGVRIGHFSPIGGYFPERDLVFVLDVLEDYRPFLVPAERLYEAMDTVDPESGEKRGLLRVTRRTAAPGQPALPASELPRAAGL